MNPALAAHLQAMQTKALMAETIPDAIMACFTDRDRTDFVLGLATEASAIAAELNNGLDSTTTGRLE